MEPISVWAIECHTLDPEVRASLEHGLDDAERQRYEAFCYPRRSLQFLIARAAIKKQLEVKWGLSRSNLRISCDPGAQPEILGAGGPAISVAQCRTLVLVASAPTAVIGVDVVPPTGCGRVLAGRFFSPAETEWLERLERQDARYRFAQMWAIKEACSKVQGTKLFPLEPLPVPLPTSCAGGRVAWSLLEPGGILAAAVAFAAPLDGWSSYPAISFQAISATGVAGLS